MKKLNKNLIVVLIAVFMFGSIGPINVYAVTATAPVLGTAASFSVLGGVAMTADASGATISGDLGVNPGLAVTGTWTHTGGAILVQVVCREPLMPMLRLLGPAWVQVVVPLGILLSLILP